MKRYAQKMILVAVVCSLTALPALAQGGGGGRGGAGGAGGEGGRGGQGGAGFQRAPQLTPEQAQAVWQLQAKGFATAAKLDDNQIAAVTELYSNARKKHGEAIEAATQKLRDEMRQRSDEGGGRGRGGEGGAGGAGGAGGDGAGGGGRGGRGARGGFGGERFAELTTEHREKLARDLGNVLEGETLDNAVLLLGSFDRQWDNMVHTLAGFELGEEATLMALWSTQDYIGAVAQARSATQDDPQAAREATNAARTKLLSEMEAALDEEQLAQFRRAMGGGRGGAGRAGGGPGGAGGDMIERLDANGDGKIQKDEMPERMQQMFDRLDTNSDGVITKDEIDAIGGGAGGAGGRRGGAGGGGGGGDGGGGRIID
ncbi:MAG: hypothetical protein ACR2GY_00665 [Phycisphaerales bacterium]